VADPEYEFEYLLAGAVTSIFSKPRSPAFVCVLIIKVRVKQIITPRKFIFFGIVLLKINRETHSK
jgi:hypothetical protein